MGYVVGNDPAAPLVKECDEPEAHEAHMAVNGECPWCGMHDPDQGGMSVEEAVERFG